MALQHSQNDYNSVKMRFMYLIWTDIFKDKDCKSNRESLKTFIFISETFILFNIQLYHKCES